MFEWRYLNIAFLLVLFVSFFYTSWFIFSILLFVWILIAYFFLTIKNPLYGLYGQVLLMPFNSLSYADFGFAIRFFHFSMPLFILGYVIHCIINNKKIVSASKLDLPLIFFLLVVVLSIFQSFYLTKDSFVLRNAFVNYPFIRSISRFVLLVLLVIFAYIVREIASRENALNRIVKFHLALATILSAFGVVVYMFYYFGSTWTLNTGLMNNNGFPRLQIFFSEPLFLGNYLLSSLTFLLYFLVSGKLLIRKVLVYFMLVVQLLAMYFTFARSALAGLFVAFVLIICTDKYFSNKIFNFLFLKKKYRIIKYIFISTIMISMLFFLYSQISSAVSPRSERFFSSFIRLHSFYSGLNAFKQHPILGVGFENFVFYGGPYIISDITGNQILLNISDTNNIILKILAELGIVGLLSFLWLISTTLFVFFKIISCNKRIVFLTPIFASLLAITIQMMFFSHIYLLHLFFLFGIFLTFIKMPPAVSTQYLKDKPINS